MAKIYIGTSGWNYDEWIGVVYKYSERKLAQYCRLFNTVEMDSTFYRIPSINLIKGIIKGLPRDFKISVKMPKIITHENMLGKLGPPDTFLERFYENIKPILYSGHAGPILIQLPPKLGIDIKLLKSFVEKLDDKYRYAIEFREPSWLNNSTFKLLEKHDIAYTIVDEPLLPPITIITTDFSYIRWHGHGSRPWYNYRYSLKELRGWIPKLREIMERVDRVYGYFNNHFHGYAAENALELLDMFGLLDEARRRELDRIKSNIEKPYIVRRRAKIKDKELHIMDIRKLLSLVTDEKRVTRGLSIKQSDTVINIDHENRISSRVRGYSIEIDPLNRVLIHDCGDWGKIHKEKRLCKHIVRVLTLIKRDLAINILRDMILNTSLWRFEHQESLL